MLRNAVLLCALILAQAMTTRTLLHPTGRCACTEAAPDDGSPIGDEALVARRVVLLGSGALRLHRWNDLALAVAPSPPPDEIVHVPKLLLV